MKDKEEWIERIKNECNHPKSDLIRLWKKMQIISPSKAEKLGKIIGQIEAWQRAK